MDSFQGFEGYQKGVKEAESRTDNVCCVFRPAAEAERRGRIPGGRSLRHDFGRQAAARLEPAAPRNRVGRARS